MANSPLATAPSARRVFRDLPDVTCSNDGCSRSDDCYYENSNESLESSHVWNISQLRMRRCKRAREFPQRVDEKQQCTSVSNNLPLPSPSAPLLTESFHLSTIASSISSASTAATATRKLRTKQTQQQQQGRPPSKWLIPYKHPLKLLWDCLTLVVSLISAYNTHVAIRDRQYRRSNNWILLICDVWFVVDILANFMTQKKQRSGRLLDTYQAVWAHYLTSWFIIDVLSLFPGERFWLVPIVDQQNRRNVWTKTLFRSRAVIKVTRWFRHVHWQWLSQCAKHVKQLFGVRLLRIKSAKWVLRYVPKYVMFYRNMRGVVAIRILRQVHWLTRTWRQWQRQRRESISGLVREKTLERVLLERDGAFGDDDDNSILFHINDDDNDGSGQNWEYFMDEDEYDDDYEDNHENEYLDDNGRALYARHHVDDDDDDDGLY
ncbi:hypothetical protein MPSEU_000679400 [Mayamaea pseudoterrestris]|nr:hypothetical protein MPSEU_000679400 [Mayamaea pseudoterrestris]